MGVLRPGENVWGLGVVVVSRSDKRTNDAKALLAICELMQCKLLSPQTIAYLAEVRDSLEAQIKAESGDPEEAVSA